MHYRTVKLLFAKEMTYRVYDDFDISQIKRQENGKLVVEAMLPEDAWIVGFLLSFGDKVEIIEPAYLRDIVARQAKDICNLYALD